MNGGKQIGKYGKQGEEGLRDAEVEDHDPVERAVDRHERHGDGGVDEGKLEAFEEHFYFPNLTGLIGYPHRKHLCMGMLRLRQATSETCQVYIRLHKERALGTPSPRWRLF